MSATREQLIEANKKAVLSPNIGKHGKWKKTLLEEEAIAIFRERQTQKWEETIDKLPPVYVADRMMGETEKKVKYSGEVKISSLPAEAIAIIEEDLKKRKTESK